MDDAAWPAALGPHRAYDFRIVAVGNEADVLAVGLGGDGEAEFGGDLPHFGLGQAAEREAQVIELLVGRRVEEIRLVARRIERAVQFGPGRPLQAAHVMAGGEAIGAELARHVAEDR